MIETNKICEILKGIDSDECYDEDGWWETSFGVKFGKEKLQELLDYIELEKNDTGLKDINDKSIYADSSIVEFIYRPIGENRTCRDVGFIFFCKEDFMFKINILTRSDKNGDNYIFNLGNSLNSMYMKEIKIIDTIQENKLGLIK